MFQNIIQNPSIINASLEIFVIFIGALILGMILGWLIKPTFGNDAPGTETQQQDDNLQLIEGIGPKIEQLLRNSGVETFDNIVREDVAGLEVILLEGGKKFAAHNPSTWPDQARLAMKGKWSELEEYQEILNANSKKK